MNENTQPKKNPGLAAVASFFFAGLGQIYNGEILKGVLLERRLKKNHGAKL